MKPDYPLEVSAMEWLRFARQCHIVMRERGQHVGSPDVLGVTKDSYLIEIEVKRTMADFRNDQKKRHRQFPAMFAKEVRQLYYMVPPALVEKVLAELPLGCGLLTVGTRLSPWSKIPETKLLRRATTRTWAGKLSEDRKWRLIKDMASNLVTAEVRSRKLLNIPLPEPAPKPS